MKELKIKPFVERYLRVQKRYYNEWNEKCAYYSKEESQHEVFARRVNKQIIQPFLSKFKVIGFSFVKKPNLYSYTDRGSGSPEVHWSYFISFYDMMTYENSILFQWFDLIELRVKRESFQMEDVDEICFFDGSSEAKRLAKLMRINRKMINIVETKCYAYGKENMIRDAYITDYINSALNTNTKRKKTPSYKEAQKMYEKLSQHEKDEIWETCYDKAKEHNLLSLEDTSKDFLDRVIADLES